VEAANLLREGGEHVLVDVKRLQILKSRKGVW